MEVQELRSLVSNGTVTTGCTSISVSPLKGYSDKKIN